MLVTEAEVKSITNKIVDTNLITRAQYVVEAFIGKFESEITDANDIELAKRATAYQAAYMLNNEDIVYEQMAVSATGQNDSYTSFKTNDNLSPFIAPMAVIVCKRLSFMKSRSVYTGKSSDVIFAYDWRTI